MDKTQYDIIIGLEIHIQSKTKSKMFCSCPTQYFSKQPNTHVCPTCLGLPGALPVPNKRAIELCILLGLATNCDIDSEIHFDRKHYFYPDLPKGYQISQYKRPICSDGSIEIKDEDGKKYSIGIERIHQEEDVAKSTHHTEGNLEYSLIDYNKSGVPLIEIVSKPNIRSAYQAKEYASKIRQIVRYLGISDADMEKGQMRCEPNISVQTKGTWEYKNGEILPTGENKLNSKVEVKNIGSISAVEKSIEYEVERMIKEIEAGKKIVQQTRGWNADKGITEFQRSKETADDYRYMPDPDIPIIEITSEDIERISKEIVELPDEKDLKYKEGGLTEKMSQVISSNSKVAESFERLEKSLQNKTSLKKSFSERSIYTIGKEKVGPQKPDTSHPIEDEKGATGPAAAKFISGPVFSHINATGKTYEEVAKSSNNFELFSNLIESYENGQITRNKYDEITKICLEKNLDPNILLNELKEQAKQNSNNLNSIVDEVIKNNPKAVSDFKSGKQSTIGFLVGQVMQKTKGSADPNKARLVLIEKLNG